MTRNYDITKKSDMKRLAHDIDDIKREIKRNLPR